MLPKTTVLKVGKYSFNIGFVPNSLAQKCNPAIKELGLHWVMEIQERPDLAPPSLNYWEGVGHIPEYPDWTFKVKRYSPTNVYLLMRYKEETPFNVPISPHILEKWSKGLETVAKMLEVANANTGE